MAALCLPPCADVQAWRDWLQEQSLDAELKSTLDFTLATIESCTIGLVVEARGLSAACRSESRGSWANLGGGWQVVQLPLSEQQGPRICRTCSLSWKRRSCCHVA